MKFAVNFRSYKMKIEIPGAAQRNGFASAAFGIVRTSRGVRSPLRGAAATRLLHTRVRGLYISGSVCVAALARGWPQYGLHTARALTPCCQPCAGGGRVATTAAIPALGRFGIRCCVA